ncbi:MAG: LysE family transporter [Actinomycetes bacterium]
MTSLLFGLSLGLAAGVSPGPLLVLVATTTLRSGWRAGVAVACAPLLTDVFIVAAVLLVLDYLPTEALSLLGVGGGLFVIYLGVQTVSEARTATLAAASGGGEPTAAKSFGQAVFVNLVSPHPWIAWATALGPLTVATFNRSAGAAVALVVGFYAALVGVKVLVAVGVGSARHRLTDGGYRIALVGAGVLLLLVGVVLIIEFGLALVSQLS